MKIRLFRITKTAFILTYLGLLFIFTSSCSVVFTSSLSGEAHDRERYEEAAANSGIPDLYVYLYLEQEDRDADLTAWAGGIGSLPDNPPDLPEPRYFQKTVTDQNGGFSFNGLIWNTLFPQYGKTADRRQVHLLFYHRTYGLAANETPVYIVSDVTNIPGPFLLTRIMNTATIQGYVKDQEDQAALENVTVQLWVPNLWLYDSSGEITGLTEEEIDEKPVWPENPTYQLTTDTEGRYRGEISFPMLPSTEDNRETAIIRATFRRTGYIAENRADSDITDSGWDPDKDGDDNPYYQSVEISAESVTLFSDITLARESNSTYLSGKVLDTSSGIGVENVTVEIYIPSDWEYDQDGIIDPSTAQWPTSPTYTETTDAEGRYQATVEFPRRPTRIDNQGTTLARIIYSKPQYLVSKETDSDLTENLDTWDPDNRPATTNPDYLSLELANGQRLDLPVIEIKRTEFTENLEGRVLKVDDLNNPTTREGINGLKVYLDLDGAGSSDTADYEYSTSTRRRFVGDNIEDGYFNFSNLSWSDSTYTEKQSKITITIMVTESTGETPPVKISPVNYDLVSDGNNYVEQKFTN